MSSCEQFKSQIDTFLLVPPCIPEEGELAQHLQICDACRSQVDAIREAWVALPLSLEPVAPSEELKSRVLAAATRGDHIRTVGPKFEFESATASKMSRLSNVLRYVVAATVLVALISAYVALRRPTGGGRSTPSPPTSELVDRPTDLEGSKVYYVALMHIDSRTPVATHVLCDLASQQVHFVLFDLNDFQTDGLYKIWLLGSQNQVFSSSILKINDEKVGKALISLPSTLSEVTQVVVTRETREDASLPSTEILLGGVLDGKSWTDAAN